MFVLVEWYVFSAGGGNMKKRSNNGMRKNRQPSDLRGKHPKLIFPYIHVVPQLSQLYDLINTETVNCGLWVQVDFEKPGHYWLLMSDDHHRE